jgi:hypothetical protein
LSVESSAYLQYQRRVVSHSRGQYRYMLSTYCAGGSPPSSQSVSPGGSSCRRSRGEVIANQTHSAQKGRTGSAMGPLFFCFRGPQHQKNMLCSASEGRSDPEARSRATLTIRLDRGRWQSQGLSPKLLAPLGCFHFASFFYGAQASAGIAMGPYCVCGFSELYPGNW